MSVLVRVPSGENAPKGHSRPPPLPERVLPVFRGLLDRCLGVPYRHQGCDPAHGLDCLGALRYFHARLGIPLRSVPEMEAYPLDFWRHPDCGVYLARLDEQFARVGSLALPGDVYAFVVRPGTLGVSHTAMAAGDGHFLSCFRGRRAALDRITDRFWASRLRYVFRSRRMGELGE